MAETSVLDPVIPVAVFAYNRPDSLRQLLACLRRDCVPLIHAFVDSPRIPEHAPAVAEVRQMLRDSTWCQMTIVERKINLGLGKSIVLGVTEVLEAHLAVIVMEDDLVCVPGTYRYLCDALARYRNEPNVLSVTGWTHPRITPKNLGLKPYFDGRAECWSWGTWRRAWRGMESTDAAALIKQCRKLGIWPRKYGDDLPKMAELEHQSNIWAVRWLYWHIVAGGLCLRPPHSLVEHRGTGPTATNVGADNAGWQNPPLKDCPPVPSSWPEPVEHPECVRLWRKACKAPEEAVSPIRRLASRIRKALLPSAPRKLPEQAPPSGDVTFSGDYATWEEASAQCEGYASSAIMKQVIEAARMVKSGEAACERDGVPLKLAEHPWPVLAAIFRAAHRCARGIRVLDFGGSLGSLYFQTRHILGSGTVSQWCVVEQPHFVEAGQREFADEVLSFCTDVPPSLRSGEIDLLLLSGVLQYLPRPHEALQEMIAWHPRHILVDRTPLWPVRDMPDKLALQTVSALIYPARYPVWFFNRRDFLAHFAQDYSLAAEFDAKDQFYYSGLTVTCRGCILDRNEPNPRIR